MMRGLNNNIHYQMGYKKGVSDGGFYWTSILTVALHNLYGWTSCFDKIEAEMQRIYEELGEYKQDGIMPDKLIEAVLQIRGKDYFEGDNK